MYLLFRLRQSILQTLARISREFEKRCEARQNEIRDGSVAGIGSHKRHNTGESAIEEQRSRESSSSSPCPSLVYPDPSSIEPPMVLSLLLVLLLGKGL